MQYLLLSKEKCDILRLNRCQIFTHMFLRLYFTSLRRSPQSLEIRRRKDGCYMKLIYAIIRYDNEDDVTTSLTKHKFSVTRLSTTGGFLKKGNTTLMIVTEPERVDEAIDIIKKECGHHQKITINMPYVSGSSMVHCATMPMSVDVGGATIFVVDVERYEKI